MKKSHVIALAFITAVSGHGAIASTPEARLVQGPGVTTGPDYATVRPDFPRPATSKVLVKAGAAASTSCTDTRGYAVQAWARNDRWGSFPIVRPQNVAGAVRYCVAQRFDGSSALHVKYDVIGE